jgi:RimJ/RimL family protein N-acetyltransferase
VAEVPDLTRHLDFATRQFADPRVADWHWPGHLGGARTPEQAREIVEKDAATAAARGFCFWWWRERESGALVGQAGISPTEVEGTPEVELGWSLPPESRGRGFATEAAAASMSWGFEVAGLDEIVAFTLPENAPSRRVMERLGMQYVRDFEHKGFPEVLYLMRREDWPGAV